MGYKKAQYVAAMVLINSPETRGSKDLRTDSSSCLLNLVTVSVVTWLSSTVDACTGILLHLIEIVGLKRFST